MNSGSGGHEILALRPWNVMGSGEVSEKGACVPVRAFPQPEGGQSE